MLRRTLVAVSMLVILLDSPPPARAAVATSSASQATLDGPAPAGAYSGYWGDLPGGPSIRPSIQTLTINNGGAVTVLVSGGTRTAEGSAIGAVAATIAPLNLCKPGQVPAPGRCYATPNRVALTLGYNLDASGAVGIDFSSPSVPLAQPVTQSTIISVAVRMNTLGRTLRWSWVTGADRGSALLTGSGAAAQLGLSLSPAYTPAMDWAALGPVGCTATPITSCDLARADARQLAASAVLSLDETLNEAMRGSAFFTSAALFGYLDLESSLTRPQLDYQLAAPHTWPDGSLINGSMTAVIPDYALLNLYGAVPSEASLSAFFSVTRVGGGAPASVRFAHAAAPSPRVVIQLDNISFSAPNFRLAQGTPAPRTAAKARGATTTVAATAVPACKLAACSFTVDRLESKTSTSATRVAAGRTSAAGSASVAVAGARLRKGQRYALALRKGGVLVRSAVGVVA
jgi:hypothetical protein